MGNGGHGAAFFPRFHHQYGRGQRRNEPVALQKAVRTNIFTVRRVLADDAALALDLLAQGGIGCRVGAVDGYAHHRNGGTVVLHCRPVSGAVQPIGQTADDNGSVFCQFPADIRRRVQAVFRGLAAAHDTHRPGLVEPAGVAGAVEHQRHIRDAGKGQRVVWVIKGQDAHPQGVALHHQRVEAFCVQLCCTLKGCIPCRLPEFLGLPRFPRLLCAAKGVQHLSGVEAGRPQHLRQPQPAQQRVGCRLRREQAGLPGHRLSSRKCHSRMLPAIPAFRLSTRSVMGMRTVLLQAAMVSSVRP